MELPERSRARNGSVALTAIAAVFFLILGALVVPQSRASAGDNILAYPECPTDLVFSPPSTHGECGTFSSPSGGIITFYGNYTGPDVEIGQTGNITLYLFGTGNVSINWNLADLTTQQALVSGGIDGVVLSGTCEMTFQTQPALQHTPVSTGDRLQVLLWFTGNSAFTVTTCTGGTTPTLVAVEASIPGTTTTSSSSTTSMTTSSVSSTTTSSSSQTTSSSSHSSSTTTSSISSSTTSSSSSSSSSSSRSSTSTSQSSSSISGPVDGSIPWWIFAALVGILGLAGLGYLLWRSDILGKGDEQPKVQTPPPPPYTPPTPSTHGPPLFDSPSEADESDRPFLWTPVVTAKWDDKQPKVQTPPPPPSTHGPPFLIPLHEADESDADLIRCSDLQKAFNEVDARADSLEAQYYAAKKANADLSYDGLKKMMDEAVAEKDAAWKRLLACLKQSADTTEPKDVDNPGLPPPEDLHPSEKKKDESQVM